MKLLFVKSLSISLLFIINAGHGQEKTEYIDLEFNGKFSKPVTIEYVSENDSVTAKYFYFLKDKYQAYTYDIGFCFVCGQDGKLCKYLGYRLFVNKHGVWTGFLYNDPTASEGSGIVIQCIDH